MSRLSEFTVDELYAVIFAMDLAQTVEPLDELVVFHTSKQETEHKQDMVNLVNLDSNPVYVFRRRKWKGCASPSA